MTFGDLLEWLAAAALVAASYLWHHSVPVALATSVVPLAYFGQCYDSHKFTAPFRRPKS